MYITPTYSCIHTINTCVHTLYTPNSLSQYQSYILITPLYTYTLPLPTHPIYTLYTLLRPLYTGTRSKTGHLLEFKKGPFHVWEHLHGAPIIPMMIYGAYELFPAGENMHILCIYSI